jgi:hypothetical protein
MRAKRSPAHRLASGGGAGLVAPAVGGAGPKRSAAPLRQQVGPRAVPCVDRLAALIEALAQEGRVMLVRGDATVGLLIAEGTDEDMRAHLDADLEGEGTIIFDVEEGT